MADPTGYDRDYSFSGFQANAPATPLPGQQVDIQLDKVSASITAIVDAIRDVRRPDGKLRNGIVTAESLSQDLALGVRPPTEWQAGVEYKAGDTVFAGIGFYRALVDHVSTDFAANLAAGLWELFADMSQIIANAEIQPDQLVGSTAFGRALLSLVNAAAARAAIGAVNKAGDAMTGTLWVPTTLFVNAANASESPAVRLMDESGVRRGTVYWDRALNQVWLVLHDATGAVVNSIRLSATGAFVGSSPIWTNANKQIADGQVLGNVSGSTGVPVGVTLSALLDKISNTRGAVLYRGASGWAALGAGAAGQVLTSGGAGADPSWQTPSGPDALSFSVLAMQVADLANQALFLGDSGNRIFDSFATLDYVDVAGATNLDTSTSGKLKPTLSSAQTFAVSLNAEVSNNDLTRRMIIDASALTTSGVQVRVRLSGPASGPSLPINNAFIGHQASGGNPWDFDGNQVRLTFNGNNGVTPPVGGSVWSDWIDFSLDKTKNLIVAHDGTVTGNIRFSAGVASVNSYYKFSVAEADSTAPTGYTLQAATVYMLDQIEVRTGAGNNMTVASTAFTAASAPASEKITARIIAVDPVTLNTDLLMDVSRDGGTTWTQVTLAEKFTQQGSVKVIESNDLDISGQPSGVAPRWRIRTANNKMVEILDMALYWK